MLSPSNILSRSNLQSQRQLQELSSSFSLLVPTDVCQEDGECFSDWEVCVDRTCVLEQKSCVNDCSGSVKGKCVYFSRFYPERNLDQCGISNQIVLQNASVNQNMGVKIVRSQQRIMDQNKEHI